MKLSQSNLDSLSSELLIQIAEHLDGPSLLAFRQVNRKLSAAAFSSFASHFFGILKPNLGFSSLERLRKFSTCEPLRRAVHTLQLGIWHSLELTEPHLVNSRNDRLRRHADHLDLTTPAAVALLDCIRTGFPNLTSFILDDNNEREDTMGPTSLYPSDLLSILFFLAANQGHQLPVKSLSCCFLNAQTRDLDALLPAADPLRWASFSDNVAANMRVLKIMLTHVEPGFLKFVQALVSSAKNLKAFIFGGSGETIQCCIDALCGEETAPRETMDGLRHVAIQKSRGSIPVGLLQRFLSRIDDKTLHRLELDTIDLMATNDMAENNPWYALLSIVRERFVNLKFIAINLCSASRPEAARRRLWFCPVLQQIKARLPRQNIRSHFQAPDLSTSTLEILSENGGVFWFTAMLSSGRAYFQKLASGNEARTRLHEREVRYEARMAEDMNQTLDDIAKGMYLMESGSLAVSGSCVGRNAGEFVSNYDKLK